MKSRCDFKGRASAAWTGWSRALCTVTANQNVIWERPEGRPAENAVHGRAATLCSRTQNSLSRLPRGFTFRAISLSVAQLRKWALAVNVRFSCQMTSSPGTEHGTREPLGVPGAARRLPVEMVSQKQLLTRKPQPPGFCGVSRAGRGSMHWSSPYSVCRNQQAGHRGSERLRCMSEVTQLHQGAPEC